MNDSLSTLAGLCILVCVFCFGFALGNQTARTKYQKQAVEAGVAEWRVIDAGGKVEFAWRELVLEVVE